MKITLEKISIIEFQNGVIFWTRIVNYSAEFKNKIQKLAVQRLVNHAGYSSYSHLENGAPVLPNSDKHISISHSEDVVVLAISSNPIGIDVEKSRSSLQKGRHYFMTEAEIQQIDEAYLLHVWTAKEAMYKLMQGECENAKSDFQIRTINKGKKQIQLAFQKEMHMLYFKEIEDFLLVFSSSAG